jgi:hypothetical protein
LGRDAENSYLAAADLEAGTMTRRLGSSITYHIAIRPRKGRNVFTLQTLPSCDEPIAGGFGKGLYSPCMRARTGQHQNLERLCRYAIRLVIAEQGLSLTPHGDLRYQLKPPYRESTMQVATMIWCNA